MDETTTTNIFEQTIYNQSPDKQLRRSVGPENANRADSLHFCFLGTEPNAPYGPILHTAQLFLDLLCQTALKFDEHRRWNIQLRLYDVQQKEFPSNSDEWNRFDGIIVPGSFSTSYHTKDWILHYQNVIQKEIVAPRRKTLGVCFGHQILAHSYTKGEAVQTPAGAHAGRHTMSCTKQGEQLLGGKKTSIDLFYTHGDMVQTLPPCAVSLGGNDRVPIQAAAYYGSESEANQAGDTASNDAATPFAITFQAHPEYATSKDLGLLRTLNLIMNEMKVRGSITPERWQEASRDALDSYELVRKDSLEAMLATCVLLRWFVE